MNSKKIRGIGAGVLVALWLALTLAAWFLPPKETSIAERRRLEQFPALTGESILSGKFMTSFETYTQDQFPLRDTFRQLKSLFHYYALWQGDNNGIYVAGGYAAALEYPINQRSLEQATGVLDKIYQTYLAGSGSKIFLSVVPDKSYYLAEANGYPAMDYDALFAQMRDAAPWATYVDITDCLSLEDYYHTDTHWRQERILPVAQKLCQALGVTAPQQADYTAKAVSRPFYGVYYGQAALPMAAETIYVLESDDLSACTVQNMETGKTTGIYDWDKAETSQDLYDVYLSGATPLLVIDNPNAATDRELIVFRDSFGSSLTPLLLGDYRTVTVVDTRYVDSSYLGKLMEFHGQDVLLLYSTLVLNSGSLK